MSRGSTAELQGLDAEQESESNSTTLSPVSPNNKLEIEEQVEAKARDEVEEIERLEERVEELERQLARRCPELCRSRRRTQREQ